MKPVYKEKYPHLFEPMYIGKKRTEFKNRILMSPIGSCGDFVDLNGRINDYGVEFYTRIAQGGFASITLAVEVPENGGHLGATRISEDVDGFVVMHQLQRAVHTYRAQTLCEIYHAGCCMLPDSGHELISASSFIYNGHQVREMNEEDMEYVTRLYVDAAFMAKRSGFDGLCLHYGHGWLMNNYLSPLSNHRKDIYGGSVENRTRFPLQVIKRIREVIGDELFIELRMNGTDRTPGGIVPEDAAQQALIFQDYVDMIHVSCGTRLDASCRPKMHPTGFVADAHNAEASEALKKAGVKVPVGVVGSVHDPVLAERLLAEGKADYILMARQLYADPEWVNKVKEDRLEDIRPCIRCDYCLDGGRRGALTTEVNIHKDSTFDGQCSVNPTVRQGLSKLRTMRPTTPKKVAVIGGGIAGMQAAVSAANRGHEVVLFEKSDTLGGQTFFADHEWFKRRIVDFRQYLITQVHKAGVTVLLNTEATPAMLEQADFHTVVVAVGGEQIVPPIPGVNGANVRLGWDVYGKEKELGKKVAMVGGGSVGCELAIHLAELGHEPTILEMAPYLAASSQISERISIQEHLDKHNILTCLETRCTEITPSGVNVVDKDGKTSLIPADSVIICTGTSPLAKVRDAFRDVAFEVITVGDCRKVGTIRTAVDDGWNAGVSI